MRTTVRQDTTDSPSGSDWESDKQEPIELQPTEQEGTPPQSPKPSAKLKRSKTYLPDDFTVTDRMYAWAVETYGWSRTVVDERTERMRRYCLRNAKQYADWEQAWRGFMEPKSWDSAPAPPGQNGQRALTISEKVDEAMSNIERKKVGGNSVIEATFTTGDRR